MKRSLILLLIGPLTASAAYFNSLPRNCESQHTAFGADLAGLSKTNLMPMLDEKGNPIKNKDGTFKDKRSALSVGGPKLSGDLAMNEADMKDASDSVGYIDCGRDSVPAEKSFGTGAIYGGNGRALVSAYHVMFHPDGSPKGPCYFRKPGNPKIKPVLIDLQKSQIIQAPSGDYGQAIVLVRLTEPARDANSKVIKGLPLDISGSVLPVGKNMAVVSALQLDEKRKNSIVPGGVEPVVQQCSRQYDKRLVDYTGPVVFSDCSMTGGASGSVGLVRVNGKLAIKTIFTGTGLQDQDWKKFDIQTKAASFSRALRLDDDIVNTMNTFASESPN